MICFFFSLVGTDLEDPASMGPGIGRIHQR
jgi:hypothetical protein